MNKISIRALLVLTLFIGASLALTRYFYDSYRYHTVIKPAWDAFPVSSQSVAIFEGNDLKIDFDVQQMDLEQSALLSPATDFKNLHYSSTSLVGHYDLNCDLGEFRIVFTGPLWSQIPADIRRQRSAYESLRDALALTPDSPMSQLPFWEMREKFGYSGTDVRIQHFQSSTKAGFIVHSGAITSIELFDSTGEYSILVQPKSTTSYDWLELASRLLLVRKDVQSAEDPSIPFSN